jgi:hypothetical protein
LRVCTVFDVNELVDVVFSGLSPLVIEGVADEGELSHWTPPASTAAAE